MEYLRPDGSPIKAPIRVKNELVFRQITVKECHEIEGGFKRVVFEGPQLEGFISRGFDDHIKLLFPTTPGGEIATPQVSEEGISWGEGQRPITRDYTPLRFDREKNELTVDFFIHASGVASDWALAAKPGDTIAMGGPRGSIIIPTDYAWQFYLCDETGLPAVKRRLAELNSAAVTSRAAILVLTHHKRTGKYLTEPGDSAISWIDAGETDDIMPRITSLRPPENDYYFWITGEGRLVKTVSDYLIEERGLKADFVRTVAYWHNKQ